MKYRELIFEAGTGPKPDDEKLINKLGNGGKGSKKAYALLKQSAFGNLGSSDTAILVKLMTAAGNEYTDLLQRMDGTSSEFRRFFPQQQTDTTPQQSTNNNLSADEFRTRKKNIKKDAPKLARLFAKKWEDYYVNATKDEAVEDSKTLEIFKNFMNGIIGGVKGVGIGDFDNEVENIDGMKAYIAKKAEEYLNAKYNAQSEETPNAQPEETPKPSRPREIPKGTLLSHNGNIFKWEGQMWSKKTKDGKWQTGPSSKDMWPLFHAADAKDVKYPNI